MLAGASASGAGGVTSTPRDASGGATVTAGTGAAGSSAGASGSAAAAGAAGTGAAGAPSVGVAGASGTGASGTGASGTGAGGTGASGTGTSGVGAAAAAGSGGSGGAPATAGACTGKSGSKRGKSAQSVMAGGRRRTFVYYAPENLDANKAVPLLIVPHGYTQSGEAMYDITKYPAIADREGFVAIFPDGSSGTTGPWDVGSNVCGNGALVSGSGDDDQMFIDEMIAFASDDQCIDREHIFMSGWSMGGYLSNHSGCLRSDIRAIGPHSAGTHDLGACKTQHKPVILFHFDPDGLIDYSCGVRARDGWVKRNGCSADAPEVTMVKGGKCEHYKGCAPDGQVVFCTFAIPPNHVTDFLAGHAWSGGTARSYSIAETESAAELGWAFFKKYAW